MLCAHCGFANAEGMHFCGRCGTSLPRPCPACGFTNPTDHVFCGKCGLRISAPQWSLSATPGEHPRTPQAHQTGQVEPPPDARRIPQAERRQLTVLFCDLVESTALAGRLDPEDYREVVRAYQDACVTVIQRFDGHIAQYLGDGLLVYFGYPQAHEDDAHRAVHTGLAILETTRQLNTRLEQERRVQLTVRVGIHTGLVVVGEMGGGGRHERLALGDTPNLAARLQGIAEPDTEVGLLLERWAHSQDGRGQGVLIHGEPGIGKSRLVEVLREHVRSQGAVRLGVFRCSPYHQQSALFPVIEHIQRFLHWDRNEAPEARLAALEQALRTSRLPLEEVTPLLAALLSLPHPAHYPPLNLTPQRQRQKTYDALVAWLLAEAEPRPVLAVWEDLHWADPSTLELLGLVLDQVPTARMLLLLTGRPEFHPPWTSHAPLTQLTLTRLGRPQVEAMITSLTGGKALPATVVEQVVAKTDGVPLFVEELVKMLLESGLVRVAGDHYVLTSPLPPLAIPATLHDSLMARLDRLAPGKAVAQLGATIGRTFAYELLQAVSPLDEAMLQQGLWQLVEAELVYRRGAPPQATYTFKHALIQDAAYQSLLRSTRQQYHQRVAQVFAERFPETVETQPELVAHHYTDAGLPAQAIPYWQLAGQRAVQRSAYAEAVSHFTKGLEVLATLPESPARMQQELDLQLGLGPAVMVAKGYGAPEVHRTYDRARALCQHLGDSPQLVSVLMGLYTFYRHRTEYRTARELAEHCLRLAQQRNDPVARLRAQYALANTLFMQGELAPARTHLEQALAFYTAQQYPVQTIVGEDFGVLIPSFLSWVLGYLGYPDQARRRSQEGLMRARALAHPITLAAALTHAAFFHQGHREALAAQEHAEAAIALATEQGFPMTEAFGTGVRGWALAMQGYGAQGLAQMQQALATLRAMEVKGGWPYFLAHLAAVYGMEGQPEAGLEVLAEALATARTNGEEYHTAEGYRLTGELLLQQTVPDTHQAETCFQQALAVARHQQIKSLELRAAMSLARLWQQQGKRTEARELLAEVYGWFTEGFDTPDLQEASALLDALA